MTVKNLITKSAVFAALMGVSVTTANAVQNNTAKAAQITLNYHKDNKDDTFNHNKKTPVGKTTTKEMFSKAKSTIKIHKTHWYKHPYVKVALNPYQIEYKYSKRTWKLEKYQMSHSELNNFDNNMGPDTYVIDGYTYDQNNHKYYIAYDGTKNNKPNTFSSDYKLLSTSFFKAPQVYQFTKNTKLSLTYEPENLAYEDNMLQHFVKNDLTQISKKYDFSFAPKHQSNTFLLTTTKAKFDNNSYQLIWQVTNVPELDTYGITATAWINTTDLKTNTKKGGTFTVFEPDWNDDGDITPTVIDTYTNKNIKSKITHKFTKNDETFGDLYY